MRVALTSAIVVALCLTNLCVDKAHAQSAKAYRAGEPQRAQHAASTLRKPVSPQRPSGDRPVRVLLGCRCDTLATGDTVPAEALVSIFFIQARCELDLEDRENMRRAWRPTAWGLGCWYPSIDGGYTYIDGRGEAHHDRNPWDALPRALLHADGTATITEPNFVNGTFSAQVFWQHFNAAQTHRNEGP